MRLALAQLNPIVGDIDGNALLIADAIRSARAEGAALVVFPEMAIIGYPPKDLLLKPAVLTRCAETVVELAADCTGIAAIIGLPVPSPASAGRPLQNGVAFCCDGRVARYRVKSLLPSYDVFDEARYFEPAHDASAFEPLPFGGRRLGLTICEDLWNDPDLVDRRLYHDDPLVRLVEAGSDMIVNCSASPFVLDKHAFRLQLLAAAAQRHAVPLVYCNQVGGNDELVFDGNSCAFGADGSLLAHARSFEPDLLFVDVPEGRGRAASGGAATGRLETPSAGIAAVHDALVLGLRDYCRKCRFASVVVGLSGGIDSAVTGALAAAALGSGCVTGVAMPSRYSSPGSVDDATALAANLGLAFHLAPIEQAHAAFESLLAPHFAGRPPDVTEENVQARIRGVILMAFSNKFGSLLVTTGNKSELAVGYCTLYGDMCGGLAILSDVPKTMVWELARWINEDAASPLRQRHGGQVIPQRSITKPPSAELRPDQTDQDSLPPYDLLDQIVERYVEREQPADRIIAEVPALDPATVLRVVRLIDVNEYKRKQAAPGIKVTGRAFGFGRRMPIAQGFENRVGEARRGNRESGA